MILEVKKEPIALEKKEDKAEEKVEDAPKAEEKSEEASTEEKKCEEKAENGEKVGKYLIRSYRNKNRLQAWRVKRNLTQMRAHQEY